MSTAIPKSCGALKPISVCPPTANLLHTHTTVTHTARERV